MHRIQLSGRTSHFDRLRPSRAGRVDGLFQGPEPDISLDQVLNAIDLMPGQARQSIEPPDFERVAFTHVVECRHQLWPVEPGTRGRLLEKTLSPCRMQRAASKRR